MVTMVTMHLDRSFNYLRLKQTEQRINHLEALFFEPIAFAEPDIEIKAGAFEEMKPDFAAPTSERTRPREEVRSESGKTGNSRVVCRDCPTKGRGPGAIL